MGEFLGLLTVCAAMLAGTYVVGTLPLAFQLSRDTLRKLELWGSGLLLGAALTVVIPEGIASVYQMEKDGASGKWLAAKDVVAVCLLSGFLLMFIVDQQMIAQSYDRVRRIARNARRAGLAGDEETVAIEEAYLANVPFYASDESHSIWPTRERLFAAVGGILGILIHALADGIAMGASSESDDASLRIVVLLAIVVHKAPASIGTCTLLMSRKLPKVDIRWAVMLFSLMTPIGALVTYSAIQMVLRFTGGSDAITSRDIGAVLSFSGGTFLYVAMHAVIELAVQPVATELRVETSEHHPHDHDHPIHVRTLEHEPDASSETYAVTGLARSLGLVILGSITPRLLQLLVGDEHD
ncbi:hypothetical protein MVES1_000211 [Malassezia vespertilionis]|uniref:uncharacterized protein n=1 Tax=Malassezia vespertilionis TaxID=2020962 RepID=UPI0024B1EC0B|nr:uncharacterized protein MVES1_000211 [Malassezia vespertilionis]WFD04886.1 hypothetical protein MVES1_000211 [Malassezia vespertilionis]